MLLKEFTNKFVFSVSHTSRKIREGEKDGVNYHYTDKDIFLKMIENNSFVEWTQYNGNYYGTSKEELNNKKTYCDKNNCICILEIETVGAKNIHDLNIGAEFISILPPNIDTLVERLHKRGTENEDQIKARVEISKREIEEINKADFLKHKIINEKVDESYEQLKKMIFEMFPKTFN